MLPLLATAGVLAVLAGLPRPSRRRARPSYVGQLRTPEEISADPEATASEIEQLAKTNPVAAIRHPNCPPEVWWGLLDRYPIEGIMSQSFILHMLECPERFAAARDANVGVWISSEISHLTKYQGFYFAKNLLLWVIGLTKLTPNADFVWKKLRPHIDLAELWIEGKIGDRKIEDSWTMVLKEKRRLQEEWEKGGRTNENYLEYQVAALAWGFVLIARPGVFSYSISNSDVDNFCKDCITFMITVLGLKDASTLVWERIVEQSISRKRYREIKEKLRDALANKFREEFYGPEAAREIEVQRQIKNAIENMEQNTADIKDMMEQVPEDKWPLWAAVGLLGGLVVLAVAGPELLVAAGAWEIAGALAASTAGRLAAAEVAAFAAQVGAREVAFDLGSLTAKLTAAEESAFLAEFAAKLASAGVLVQKAADVIVKR